jgi:hypothetical protein
MTDTSNSISNTTPTNYNKYIILDSNNKYVKGEKNIRKWCTNLYTKCFPKLPLFAKEELQEIKKTEPDAHNYPDVKELDGMSFVDLIYLIQEANAEVGFPEFFVYKLGSANVIR